MAAVTQPGRVRSWRWLVSRVVTPLFFAGVATLLVASLQSMTPETGLNGLERDAYAWHFLHRPSRPPHPAVVLVAVDDPVYEAQEASVLRPQGPRGRSLDSYRLPGCLCPAPRLCYAKAVRRLKAWGARGVVLDLLFRGPCAANGTLPEGVESEDVRLGEAMADAGNVLAAGVPDMLPLDRSRDPTVTFDMVLQPPVKPVAEAALEVGSPRVDPRDREYAVELQQTALAPSGKVEGVFALPYLAWSLYQDPLLADLGELKSWAGLTAEGVSPRLFGDFFTRGMVKGPVGAGKRESQEIVIHVSQGDVSLDEAFFRKRLLINFTTGAEPNQGRYAPARLSWLLDMPDSEGRRLFADKLVIVGNPGRDPHNTVVGMLPGAEVLANAVATMLRKDPVTPARPGEVLAVMFLLSALAAVAVRGLAPGPAALLVVSELVAIQVLAGYLLTHRNLWLMPVCPSVTLLLTTGLMGAWETSRIRGLVARLLPRRISRVMERAGGFQVEEGTVLFSDIRGYTAFSERLDPAVVMENLNAYFAAVEKVLDRYQGHFVKSPGDCVVAWFSPEKNRAHHCERAIRAALELLRNAERFREPWRRAGLHPFGVGVGINTGPMAVGVLDAHRHIEPTVIGDSVNLAARIESLTREDAPLLVSEATLAPVRDRFIARSIGEVAVVGRVQTVHLYEIQGLDKDRASAPASNPRLQDLP